MKRTYIITACIGIIAGGALYFSFSDLGGGALRQFGAVIGMYASIEPNEYNLLAQQLDERVKELDEKEAELKEQERQLVEEIERENDAKAVVYITAIGSLLLVLVLLNFYLDWKRRK